MAGRAGIGGKRGPIVHTLYEGGLWLTLHFDPESRTATIQDRTVALHDDNVILVDDVDSAGGPIVSGTRRIDPELSGTPPPKQLPILLQRSPELIDFLRCDARVPDPKARPMLDVVCAQMRGH